jgi:hypothetical protein
MTTLLEQQRQALEDIECYERMANKSLENKPKSVSAAAPRVSEATHAFTFTRFAYSTESALGKGIA